MSCSTKCEIIGEIQGKIFDWIIFKGCRGKCVCAWGKGGGGGQDLFLARSQTEFAMLDKRQATFFEI